MGKNEMLSVIDDTGEEKIVKLITYFTLLNNEEDYIAYTEYDNNDENVKVYVGRIEILNDKICLRTVESEDEIDDVKEVLVNLSNSPEEGFNYTLNNINIITKTNMKIYKDIKNIFVLKELFVNNIMDNYEYILNKQEKIFDYLNKNDLFIDINLSDIVSENEQENNELTKDESLPANDITFDFNIDKLNKQVDELPTFNIDKKIENEQENIDINYKSVEEKIDIDKIKEQILKLSSKTVEDIVEDYAFNSQENNNDIEETGINSYELSSANIENMNIPNMNELNIENNIPISIDVQMQIDFNNEKVRYLSILKKQIDKEIELLEEENVNLLNN